MIPRPLNRLPLIGGFLLAMLAAASVLSGHAALAEEVTVFAAASTTTALTEVSERFKAAQSHGDQDLKIRMVFAASSTLAKQIAEGAPADLFFSASSAWMDYLAGQGMIDEDSRTDLIGNRLVLVNPADQVLEFEPVTGFPLAKALGDGRLAIGDPDHVPAGIYAKAALEALHIWHEVAGRTARTANVRAALALVERGEAAAAIVYQSDLEIAPRVRVAAVFPAGLHPTITYPLALVAGRRTPAAEEFHGFLQGAEARGIFIAHGFRPLGDAAGGMD